MTATAIEIETTLAYARGAYTAEVALGDGPQSANLVLDTGSSTLAVSAGAYEPSHDRALRPTGLAQEITYGAGGWAGPVLQSALAFGHGRHRRRIEDAPFALMQTEGNPFQLADGILGLAYRELDPAADMTALLRERSVEPPLTWPWPFPAGNDLDLKDFRTLLRSQPGTTVTPAFDALVREGVLRDRFAFSAGRAIVHVSDDRPSVRAQAADPLNRGALVLGGGPEHQHLYRGGFQDVRVLHDLYYTANLRAVRVGDDPPIPVPAAGPGDAGARDGNALLDTGSSFLVLETSTHAAVIEALRRRDARFPALVAAGQTALLQTPGLPNHAVDPHVWPDLHLHLEAPDGRDAVLRIPASHYWPRNALRAGETTCLLMAPLPHFAHQSILGLPLFAGRYSVFDRRAHGAGVVRLATAA